MFRNSLIFTLLFSWSARSRMIDASPSKHSTAVWPKNMVLEMGRTSPLQSALHSYLNPVMSPCVEMWWVGMRSMEELGSFSRSALHVADSSLVSEVNA